MPPAPAENVPVPAPAVRTVVTVTPIEDKPAHAPGWLRWLALAGAALGLAFPLLATLADQLSGEDRAGAAIAARQFLRAVHGADEKMAQPVLAAGADFRGMGYVREGYLLHVPRLLPKTETVEVRGEKAEVHFRLVWESDLTSLTDAQQSLAGKQGIVSVVWEGGEWRVFGVKFPLDAPYVDLRSEAAELRAKVAPPPRVPPAEVQKFESLAPLDARAFAALWQTDLDVRDRPARKVMGKLVEEFGVPPIGSSGPGVAWDQRISLILKGCSREEALETVCRQVGCHPRYDRPLIEFEPGPRPQPVGFAGPLMIQATGVTESPEFATGRLSLELSARRLPFVVARRLARAPHAFRVLAIRAADGTGLLRGQRAGVMSRRVLLPDSSPPIEFLAGAGWSLRSTLHADLKNLLRDLDQIARVDLGVRLKLPKGLQTVSFERLNPGTVRRTEVGPCTLRQVAEAQPGGGSRMPRGPVGAAGGRGGVWGEDPQRRTAVNTRALDFEAAAFAGKEFWWLAYGGGGEALLMGRQDWPGSGRLRLTVPQETTSVVFKVITAEEEVRYACHLRNIPLGTRPPRRLEPARFPGHDAPVSATLLRRAGRAADYATVRITNHCQKSVERVSLRFTWRDGKTGRVKELPYTWSSASPVSISPRNLIGAEQFLKGHTAREELVLIMGLPDTPDVVRVRVTGVGFADATEWSPKR
jgi:hypothetical protein